MFSSPLEDPKDSSESLFEKTNLSLPKNEINDAPQVNGKGRILDRYKV